MKLSDLRAKAEQLGVDKAVKQAADKAAELAAKNKGTVSTWADKAGKAVDEKTGGKYHDKIAKGQAGLATGVDKLAGRHPGTRTGTAATPPVDPVTPVDTTPSTDRTTPPIDRTTPGS